MARRPRPATERRSSRPVREPYARVLIVCEGSKTEPTYLGDLRADLRLASANVQIVGSAGIGSSPSTLVEYALGVVEKDTEFDYVFCVFDRDAHFDYEAAKDRLRAQRRNNSAGEQIYFVAVTSNPAFEYWLLLHHIDTDRPYLTVGTRSSGAQVLSDLKREFPPYAKGMKGVFSALKDRLPVAMQRARRINALGNENPHTRMVDLFEWLTDIRDGNRPVAK